MNLILRSKPNRFNKVVAVEVIVVETEAVETVARNRLKNVMEDVTNLNAVITIAATKAIIRITFINLQCTIDKRLYLQSESG
jgi:uncharacterized protein YifN (PemK superfamily)